MQVPGALCHSAFSRRCLARQPKDMTMPTIQTPPPVVLTARQATQGIKLGHMRYVLGIGLALAVCAGAVLAILH